MRALLACEHQRSLSLVVRVRQAGPQLDEPLDCLLLALGCRMHEGCLVGLIQSVDPRALLHEELGHVGVAAVAGQVQRRRFLVKTNASGDGVDAGAVLQ